MTGGFTRSGRYITDTSGKEPAGVAPSPSFFSIRIPPFPTAARALPSGQNKRPWRYSRLTQLLRLSVALFGAANVASGAARTERRGMPELSPDFTPEVTLRITCNRRFARSANDQSGRSGGCSVLHRCRRWCARPPRCPGGRNLQAITPLVRVEGNVFRSQRGEYIEYWSGELVVRVAAANPVFVAPAPSAHRGRPRIRRQFFLQRLKDPEFTFSDIPQRRRQLLLDNAFVRARARILRGGDSEICKTFFQAALTSAAPLAALTCPEVATFPIRTHPPGHGLNKISAGRARAPRCD